MVTDYLWKFSTNYSSELIRYFTLGHGIAHNRVKLHDLEHEIYFSSICQKFLPELSKLMLI